MPLDAWIGALLLFLGGVSVVVGLVSSLFLSKRRIEKDPAPTPQDLNIDLRYLVDGVKLGLALALLGGGFLLVGYLRARRDADPAPH